MLEADLKAAENMPIRHNALVQITSPNQLLLMVLHTPIVGRLACAKFLPPRPGSAHVWLWDSYSMRVVVKTKQWR